MCLIISNKCHVLSKLKMQWFLRLLNANELTEKSRAEFLVAPSIHFIEFYYRVPINWESNSSQKC